MRRLGIVLLSISLLILIPALVGLALAQSEAPDHDYLLAKSKFGQNPDCPKGEVLRTSEWEVLAERQAEIETPQGVELGTVEPLDYVLVVPDDPQPYLKTVKEVPSGTFAVVPCVAISPDRMVLADDTADFFGEGSSE